MSGVQFGEFPIAEYEDRAGRAREFMNQHNLDAALFTQEANIRYFAGGPISDICKDGINRYLVLFPKESEPVLICHYANQGIARTTWFEDRRFWQFNPDGSLLVLSQNMILAAEVIREKGLAEARIGIEMDSGLRLGLTLKEWNTLKEELPGVTWRSSSPVVWGCRGYKSPLEIEKHRQASAITCAAWEQTLKAVTPGTTERDIAGSIYTEMFRRGATGRGFLSVTVGPPRGAWCDARAADVPAEKGCLIILDGGCTVNGYTCDMCRVASVGPPSQKNREMFELAYRAQRDVEVALTEGAVIGEIHAISRKPFEDAGLGPQMSSGGYGQLGHGIGLSMHEPPDLSRDSEGRFSKGMVFAIEPAVSDHADRGKASQLYILENNFAITDNGVERLTPLDDALLIV